MKKLVIAAVSFFITTAAIQAQGQTKPLPQRIAFVNINKVYDTLPEKDSIAMELQAVAMDWRARLEELEKEYAKKDAELKVAQANKATSPIMLEIIQGQVAHLEQEYGKMQQAAQSDMESLQRTKAEPVFKSIKEAIAAVSKNKGYTAALDNSTEIVLYIGFSGDDITDAVISYMLKPAPAAPKK